MRRAGKPIIVIANKAESTAGKAGVYEVFGLGLGEPIAFSAEHGEGLSELYDALVEVLPAAARLDPDEESEAEPLVLGEEEDGSELDLAKPLRIAVLGRPNAGKSTLINQILGQDRLLVGPEPGITRDSIGLDTEWNGRKIKIFDTAGLRRKSRIVEKVEKLAVADALRAVRFAEVVVLLLDATIPFERQDLTLADLVEKEGRALVIGLNKWDLVDNKSDKARELREEADRLLPQLRGTRVIPLSGLTGAHVDKLMEAIMATDAIWNIRISTGRLNRWLGPVIDGTPPPAVSGRRIKIRYMTQPKARPPHFVLFGNSVDKIAESYKRYLVNGLRETFGLIGVPIRLSMRAGSKNPYAPKKRWDSDYGSKRTQSRRLGLQRAQGRRRRLCDPLRGDRRAMDRNRARSLHDLDPPHVRAQAGRRDEQALQSAWNAHGADSFAFRILEEIDLDELTYGRERALKERVAHWREKLGGAPRSNSITGLFASA